MRITILLHLFGALFLLQACVADRAGITDPGGLPRDCSPGCENGGTCAAGTCDCSAVDYEGRTCSDAIDDCPGVDCHNGDCVDAVREAICNCDPGWTIGDAGLCTVKVQDCNTPRVCVHGTCKDNTGEVVCEPCDDGYAGTNCNILVNCGNPPNAPAYAELVGVTGTEYGDSATYACAVGFGSDVDEVDCQADGDWATPVLDCGPPDCGNLEDPAHGSVSTSGTTLGSIATYDCDAPYVLQGDATRACGVGGHWSGEAPTCFLENPCTDNPCVHGDCDNPAPGTFDCDCDRGWKGETCAEDIDECNGGLGPCNPDGTDACINEPGSFDCDCDSSHHGQFCHKLD